MDKRILIIDDDIDILNIYQRSFKDMHYTIELAENGFEGLEKVVSFRPDLIILDIVMPKMNGYEFCAALRKQEGEVSIPIVFASAEQENDRLNAFSFGAVDYLVKPFRKNDLLDSVKKNIDTGARWSAFLKNAEAVKGAAPAGNISGFLGFLAESFKLPAAAKETLLRAGAAGLYTAAEKMKIQPALVAQSMAEFYKMFCMPFIDPESVILGFLPVAFLHSNKVVPIKDSHGNSYFVVAEPFNEGLVKLLKNTADYPFAVAESQNIEQLFDTDRSKPGVIGGDFTVESASIEPKSANKLEGTGIAKLANILLSKAVLYEEENIFIELNDKTATIRFGKNEPFEVAAKTGAALTVRYKLLAGLDMVENTKPQSGEFKIGYTGKKYKMQATTSVTAFGEGCEIRIFSL